MYFPQYVGFNWLSTNLKSTFMMVSEIEMVVVLGFSVQFLSTDASCLPAVARRAKAGHLTPGTLTLHQDIFHTPE